jgi:hypothetical protein
MTWNYPFKVRITVGRQRIAACGWLRPGLAAPPAATGSGVSFEWCKYRIACTPENRIVLLAMNEAAFVPRPLRLELRSMVCNGRGVDEALAGQLIESSVLKFLERS